MASYATPSRFALAPHGPIIPVPSASQGGDAWFNNSKHYYDTPVAGNYA